MNEGGGLGGNQVTAFFLCIVLVSRVWQVFRILILTSLFEKFYAALINQVIFFPFYSFITQYIDV